MSHTCLGNDRIERSIPYWYMTQTTRETLQPFMNIYALHFTCYDSADGRVNCRKDFRVPNSISDLSWKAAKVLAERFARRFIRLRVVHLLFFRRACISNDVQCCFAVFARNVVVRHHPHLARVDAIGEHIALFEPCGKLGSMLIPVPPMSKMTMFVCAFSGSIFTPGISAIPRARSCALAWSSSSRAVIFSNATIPAAANTPTCRIPPPNILRAATARSINAREPAINDPTGAHSPLDKQNITESKGRASSATSRFIAVAALNMRAPSR